MSKGNMLLGYARGKVGDVVMARALGKQQTRAYNDKPKNPKTESQMNQRVKMLNLINFYKFSKNYLQYEKGGSNTKFSTFNKFVRFNIAATPNYLTKEQFLNNVNIANEYYYSIGSLAWPNFPAVGGPVDGGHTYGFTVETTFSSGSKLDFNENDSASYVLSTFFQHYGAKSTNPILTLFLGTSYVVTPDPAPGNPQDIAKTLDAFSFSINPNDYQDKTFSDLSDGISLLGDKVLLQMTKNDGTLRFVVHFLRMDENNAGLYFSATCWSTVINGRLKVSTSKITLSSSLLLYVERYYQTDAARIAAINSYKVGEPIELRTGTPID